MLDLSKYPKERVLTYLKYVANAAARHMNEKEGKKPEPIYHKTEPKKEQTMQTLYVAKKTEKLNKLEEVLEKRLNELTDDRIEKLNTKVEMHYTDNKYLPFEKRLKKLRSQIYRLKRRKTNRLPLNKLNSLLNKINRCNKLLREIKKADMKKSPNN